MSSPYCSRYRTVSDDERRQIMREHLERNELDALKAIIRQEPTPPLSCAVHYTEQMQVKGEKLLGDWMDQDATGKVNQALEDIQTELRLSEDPIHRHWGTFNVFAYREELNDGNQLRHNRQAIQMYVGDYHLGNITT